MKNFISKIIIFILCFIAVVIIVIIIFPYNKNGYMRAYAKKIELLETIKQPRMIFVGGSNLAFGLNSNFIQDSLNLNVINNGLHASIGLKFMMDDILDYAQKRDIIILCPEYVHFFWALDRLGISLADIVLEVDHSKIKHLNLKQKIKVITNIPRYIKSNLTSSIMGILPQLKSAYTLDAFNDKGDVVKHWGMPPKPFKSETIGSVTDFNEETLNYFISKIKSLKDKGCYVYLLPPALNTTSYELSKSSIDLLTKKLRDENIEYIFDTAKSAYPDSLFYDTNMHLNYDGAIIRSTQFVSEFKKIFPTNIQQSTPESPL